MIAIIGAMEIEVSRIRSHIQNPVSNVISGCTYVSGKLNGCDAVVVQCGVGKVNAALCTEALILNYHPDVVINSGVAGSLTDALTIGGIALGERVVQHDVDTTALGDPIGMVSTIDVVYFPCSAPVVDQLERAIRGEGIPMMRGTIASGDQFVTAPVRERILANFDCIACEQEAGAIGQVCYVNGVEFAILRSISDNADGSSHDDYPQFCRQAADRAAEVMLKFAGLRARESGTEALKTE